MIHPRQYLRPSCQTAGQCHHAEERTVVALVKDAFGIIYAIAQCESRSGVGVWQYCAEFPSVRNVTNHELAEWLAKGNGEVCTNEKYVYTQWSYVITDANKTVKSPILVKKFEDTEWHEPTIDYMGIK